MTLLSEASFLVTPNGYKASKLYAAIPTNGNGDMTVTRATTATRVDENDLVSSVASNVPRIDYTGGGCPSILLEPQRTNLLLRSQEFDNAPWGTAGSITITANNATSPDGTQNADLFSQPSSSAYRYQNLGVLSGTITTSIFVKKGSQSSIAFGFVAGSYTGGMSVIFDFDTQTFGTPTNYANFTSISATYQSYGNGWYRLNLTGTTATSTAYFYVVGSLLDSFAVNAYIFGGQLEAGAYPTSYIPTVASTVTRNVDVISKTGISDLLNPSEGTFYAETSALANDLTNKILSLSDGTANNSVEIRFSSVSNQIRLDTFGAGATYRALVTVSDITENHKVLIKWGPSGIFGFIDGDKYTFFLAAGTGSGIPTALDRFNFSIWWGGAVFYGKCKGVQIYKTALSDPQCQALTTL